MSEDKRPPGEYVTLQEAAEILGVSRFRMARLAADEELPVFTRPADRRVKLFKRGDVERLREPQPLERQEGKALAA